MVEWKHLKYKDYSERKNRLPDLHKYGREISDTEEKIKLKINIHLYQPTKETKERKEKTQLSFSQSMVN